MKIPQHIGFIMDGNRRYAVGQGMPKTDGHSKGADVAEAVVNWVVDRGITQASFYTFSKDNFNRTERELEVIFELFRQWFRKLTEDNRIHEHKVRVVFAGDITLFPDDIQEIMHKLMEDTKDYNKHRINMAMGYSSRAEIVRAAQAAAAKGTVTEESLTSELYVPENIDLVIRTGGAQRLSDFFLWQCSYAEFMFLEKMWPELTTQDLDACLEEFGARERRFGR